MQIQQTNGGKSPHSPTIQQTAAPADPTSRKKRTRFQRKGSLISLRTLPLIFSLRLSSGLQEERPRREENMEVLGNKKAMKGNRDVHHVNLLGICTCIAFSLFFFILCMRSQQTRHPLIKYSSVTLLPNVPLRKTSFWHLNFTPNHSCFMSVTVPLCNDTVLTTLIFFQFYGSF